MEPDGLRGAQRVPIDAPYPEPQEGEDQEGQEADQYAIYDGEYSGAMTMSGKITGSSTEETGLCTVQMTFDHTEIEHEMRGTFTCTSDESTSSNFAQMHQAFGEGKLFGGVIDGEFKGEFWYGPINGNWIAELTDESTFNGGWSDRYESNNSIPQLPSFDHRGQFTLERQ